jgi:DNA recombination protein RmuC
VYIECFDERIKKLSEHIRQANKDVVDVQISSRKISEQFAKIEAVEMHEDSSQNKLQ